MKAEHITFTSEGTNCSGLLYKPQGKGPYPAVVMAHGFSLVKEVFLPQYAKRFAEAGLAVLAFDYRNFGESEGDNRQHMDPAMQIEDYRNAISYMASQDFIDGNRIGIWGSSYSGGHVLQVGAMDCRVKAIVSQVPTIRGILGMEKKMGKENIEIHTQHLADYRQARYEGAPVEYIKVVSEDGKNCAQTHHEAFEWFTKKAQKMAHTWENRLTLESMEKYMEYYPASNADLISPTPLLMVVAIEDGITPATPAIDIFNEKISEPKKLVELPKGHFDLYDGDTFERAQQEAADWFVEHLGKELSQ
ncbi:acetylxylan esterase [Sporosarcina sp. P16a]|uniref:alpha/beta hydrolase n=1 Tax=unclassified Sporosarcina TaxID=2647733 RepID=UPI000C162F62|nr:MULTISPECIES: alpha/beta hydrolase [unclassified Sporosarcina]PIC67554.1 acetylxylan esterase [Sporosarcina sp. P16a]PIC93005.1 acetylxylan esterase [Sporosarcina sp. P25]